MKKIISSLTVLALTLGLAGCGSNQDTTSTQTPATTSEPVSYSEEKTADIIVVGAGGAGLAAAITAVEQGAESVIILEKSGTTGGNLMLTSGSMSAANTTIQQECGIEDTFESFEADIYKNGAELGNKELIKAFVEENTPTFEWLYENGLKDHEFSMQNDCAAVFAPEHQLYSIQRTYKPKVNDKNYKAAAHEVLDSMLAQHDNITVEFNTEATQLVANDKGQVLSVLANDTLYTANKGVIMATGGYSGNFKLMEKYAAQGAGYLSSTTSMGEGIRMMQQVGAHVDEENMSYIPTFPMGVQTGERSGVIGSTYTWKTGGICVNQEGNRFVNEQEDQVDVREVALEEQTNAVQYDIYTDKILEDLRANNGSMMFDLYFGENGRAKQLVVSAPTLEELAEKIGADPNNLVATVESYNAAVEAGGTDEFGRDYSEESVGTTYNLAVNKIEGDMYYAIPLKALVVMTLGGVSIDTNARVLDDNGTAIPGLYAAGEVTGGIWGKFVSGGTGVMGPITFGRMAAKAAMSDTLATDYTVAPASFVLDESYFEVEKPAVHDRFNMETALKDGTYSATVDGQEGPMTVETTVAEGKISAVNVTEAHETAGIADGALNELPTAIVEANSVNIDVVSGSTLTSNRILDAVTDCLTQAAQ